MACNKDKLLAVVETSDIIACDCKHLVLLFSKGNINLELIYNHVEGIYDGVTGDINTTMDFFFEEVLLTEWGWREIVGSNATGDLAVHLLWPWTINVMGAETCLYMGYRYLCIEGGKSSCCGGSSIAMDKDNIRTTLLKDVAKTDENTCSHIGEILSLLHYVEVVVGTDIENLKHLVEHFAMLTCDAYDGFKLF